jgi:large conductance mechanosensitive channel
MKFIEEFKSFAVKGNMVDMGVGIIIGGAFTSIVNSLVNDVLMPPLGLLTGNVDFADKACVLKAATETDPAVSINYGLLINALISFLIVALVIFVIIKQMNRLQEEMSKKEEKVEEETESKPDQVDVLTEIRDLIKDTRI